MYMYTISKCIYMYLEHGHGVKGLVSHTDYVSGHAPIHQPIIGQLHQLTIYLQATIV